MGAAGTKFSEAEAGDWRTRVARFCNKTTEPESARSTRQRVKRALNVPRQASLDFLIALDHQLDNHFGEGLSKFAVAKFLECPIQDGFVVFPPEAGCAPRGVPPLLVVSGDQASDQCAPFAYMMWKLELHFQQFPDPSHMSNNSSLGACVKAGFHGPLRISIAVYNLRYGPRNNGQLMRELEDAGADIGANLDHNDELVQALWPAVCEEQRRLGAEESSPEACDAWLQGLAASRTCSVKGPQAGSSRWYSWVHAAKFWQRHWTETVLVCSFLAISNGWSKDWTDVFSSRSASHGQLKALQDAVQAASSSEAPANEDDDQALHVHPVSAAVSALVLASGPAAPPRTSASAPPSQRGAARAPSRGASDQGRAHDSMPPPAAAPSSSSSRPSHVEEGMPASSDGGSRPMPAASKAQQEAAGRATLKAVKDESRNSLHALLRLMGREEIKHDCRMVVLATEPFSVANGAQQRAMLGESATMGMMISWSKFSWLDTLKQCVRTGTNWSELELCGLSLKALSKGRPKANDARATLEMEMQDSMYSRYWSLIFFLCREHGSTMMHYVWHYPSAAAGALEPDLAIAQATMETWREHCQAFNAALEVQTPHVAELLRRHPFRSVCMRYGNKFATAAGWSPRGPQLTEWLRTIFRSMLNTVMVERSAQRLRDHETRGQQNKTMHNFSSWEVLFQAGLFAEFQREEVSLGVSGAPPPGFGDRLFNPPYGAKAGGGLDLHGILKNPSWPSYTAQSQKLVYAQMAALLDLYRRGDFSLAAAQWHVTLWPEKAMIQTPDMDAPAMVLQVWESAALLWPMTRTASDMYALDMKAEKLIFRCAYDFEDIMAPLALGSA